MTTLLPKRKPQSHTTQGAQTELELAAAGAAYPDWPDSVQRPTNRSVKAKALEFWRVFQKNRTPKSWAPADWPRLALLCRTLAYLEREQFWLAEGRGGDDKKLARYQSLAALLSRQIGLNTSAVDPRLHGAAAEARRRADETLRDLGSDDGLLAMPGSPSPFKPN